MSEATSIRQTLRLLWFRLTSVIASGLVFGEALELASGKIRGWSFYLTTSEVVFEASIRLVVAALAGMAIGTIAAALTALVVWFFKSRRQAVVEWATNLSVIAIVFFNGRLALFALIKSSYQIAEHRGIIDTALYALYYLAFVVAIFIPRTRRALITSLDGLLKPSSMRRIAIATVGATVALVALEFAIVKATAPSVKASSPSPRPKSNLLLITFDALSAEDMSVYGYKLPTTPSIEAFASKATLFSNFYSASTFTTPCVAIMLTGEYPSEHHVYQLQGRLSSPEKTLPHLLRDGGYTTAAFFSNPYAYYLSANLRTQFDLLPQPGFREGAAQHLWNATALLHQDSGFGSRIEEYIDLLKAWHLVSGDSENLHERYRAAASFEEGREFLGHLPDGFFLWIHVMTPHGPYYPDVRERGRFIDPKIQEIFEGDTQPHWKPHYPAREQSKVDKYRLRYDEFILTADREFGSFMADFEKSGRLQNTTVILSADHGESFAGGIFQHGVPEQTRPVIHIPLIIRIPGQQQGRKVTFAADQTALAPTILELAGVERPAWMRGTSLAPILRGETEDKGPGLAFTEYFEKNSIFKPLRHGTVGVIDGEYQYVLDLDSAKGVLRPLSQAQDWMVDESSKNPAKAQQLIALIYSRFPEFRSNSK